MAVRRQQMPITLAVKGQEYQVQRITGKDEVRRYLENLGVVAGGLIMVVAESSAGLIVNAKGTRLALDLAMARRIMI
jgi:ferrous iron transport protein A